MNWYTEHYLKSLKLKDPELKESFEAERRELDSLVGKCGEFDGPRDRKYLDAGTGNGRLLFPLAVRERLRAQNRWPVCFIGIDKDPEVLDIARAAQARVCKSLSDFSRGRKKPAYFREILDLNPNKPWARDFSRGIAGLNFYEADARTGLGFPVGYFDMTFSGYNTLGGMTPGERRDVIRNMVIVTRDQGKIANIVWKNDFVTSNFLQRYYSAIGFKVLEAEDDFTVVRDENGNRHRIDRPRTEELVRAYETSPGESYGWRVEHIEVKPLGPLYKIVTGTKTPR